MVKQTEVLKKIRKAAKAQGLTYTEQELTRHLGITVGTTSTTVPRHNEVNEITAQAIFKQLSGELGEGWWR